MSFYVAGKLGNVEMVRKVSQRCVERGWGACTYDWTAHGSIMGQGEDSYRRLAEIELGAVLEAKFVVVVMPGGRGTHVELGAALASGKLVYILFEKKEDLVQDGYLTIFYYHPRVRRMLLADFMVEGTNVSDR